ncbi:NUDIX domain-containing protein [Pseudogemmobacter humi]|uniref:ADP-ribose pyrophosphatase n=1 Tax=Pseudogemmobacter humi TaxID=2483812 RepID=A0A3P5XPJ1_9RHOB|nr:NUDIX domain-containing protein [Pseudogemmobacter humi]VDC30694.1 ADP-ribose pyrophosphatase [Pseudogemmobacter humi]
MAALEVSGRDDPRLDDPALLALILGPGGTGGAARLAFWQAATLGQAAPDPALERRLAGDILALMGRYPADRLAQLRGPMLSRAASALRADRRAANGPLDGAVEVSEWAHPFRGFFAVEVADLRHRRFAGGMTGPIRREMFVATDAVTVLPYDPLRDRVLLVEQFRAGPLARGEARPWLIEAVAGRIDAGETPEQAARREAAEEAGIALGALIPVADYYPSPGAMTEYLYSYVALADLPEGTGGLHGLESEGEDIRTHVIPFDQAMRWMAEGRLANAPLILSLFWLARERERLRGTARGL